MRSFAFNSLSTAVKRFAALTLVSSLAWPLVSNAQVTQTAAKANGLSPEAIAELPLTPGVGQTSPTSPVSLGGLLLSDPLVQQKYLNNPELLRFLRGTYAQACTRGTLNEAVKHIKSGQDAKYSADVIKAASKVVQANSIWKLNSLEMEHLFGTGYTYAAYYCDCLMKELADTDLVDPLKSLEVVDELPASTKGTCELLATEKTQIFEMKYGTKK